MSAGAAISFMMPFSCGDAVRFWRDDVQPDVSTGRRIVLGAKLEDEIVGTVQLVTAMPPNQPHRCEVAKMIVRSSARHRRIGRRLVDEALDRARSLGRTLVTLDPRTGDRAEPLYAAAGFATAGLIPDFAWHPDGGAMHATTYNYCRI